jgi:hypothetical protein
LREEHRLRVSGNRALRRIFGPKREEDGPCRKLHNDELQSLYYSPNIVRVIKLRRVTWAGHVARMGEGRVVYRFLVGRPEGKKQLGRHRCRWEDNFKIGIGVRGQAFVNTVINLWVHKERRLFFYKLCNYQYFKEHRTSWTTMELFCKVICKIHLYVPITVSLCSLLQNSMA